MRKWALLSAAAAALLAGCDTGHTSSGGGGGGGGGPQQSSVNQNLLNKPGLFELTFDTGQGRAFGDPTAVIRRVNLVDTLFPPGDSRNNVDTLLNPERRLGLNQYTSQTVSLNIPMTNLGFSGPVNGRLFTTYTLNVDSLDIEGQGTLTGSANQPLLLVDFPSSIQALAGRETSMQVFLDDAMLNAVDNGQGLELAWDQSLFEQVNLTDDGSNTGTNRIFAHIGDFIVFDITNVPNKPTMSNSVPATRVWFSGDEIALSGDPGSSPEPMEILTPLAPPIEGLFSQSVVLPGGNGPGTYTVRQVDPRDLSNLARIIALQGTWKDYTNTDASKSPFLNLGTFECFTFPQSPEYRNVGGVSTPVAVKHDMIVVARNGAGQITNLYFGEMNFESNTFAIWPIDQVDDGDAANEVDGSISNLLDRNGGSAASPAHVRSGTFTITAGGVPSGFNQSGRFIVYRL